MKNGLLSLIAIVALAVGGLGATLAAGNEPLLGLDLQGGVSVVLQPAEEAESDAIGQAIEIIRQRIDGLGVAEPEIARQGDTIVVQLPGVKDRDRALELVGQTAELRFRPVLEELPPGFDVRDEFEDPLPGFQDALDDAFGPDGDSDGEDPDAESSDGPPEDDATTDADAEPDAGDDPATTDDPASEDGADEGAFGFAEGEYASAPLQDADADSEDPETTDDADAPADETDADEDTGEPADETDLLPDPNLPDPAELESDLSSLLGFGIDPDTLGEDGLTTADGDIAEATVILPQIEDGEEVLRYRLGPTSATGEIVSGARADLQGLGTWFVSVDLTNDGLSTFNQISSQCFNRQPGCPSGRLAIVLDGAVVSAPNIQSPTFTSNNLSITGQFDEGDAKDLALVLRYGSLPVELEPQQTRSVSATIGKDSLDAGVTAGLVGLALVAIYMIVYYRLLGLVAMASLAVSAALLWTVIAYLGDSQGLALTLAGVTGIIVSIGVAVDSNVVFYEHLKEDVANGRTLRSAVDGSFATAFSTIVKADVASLIGAVILYLLTVGPVRGFALYLGLATILDLVASYFFMRPAARLLVRAKGLADKPRMFGMPRDGAIDAEVPA